MPVCNFRAFPVTKVCCCKRPPMMQYRTGDLKCKGQDRPILPMSSQSKNSLGSNGKQRMIRLYFHPTPNPAKVALMLEEIGLAYQLVPIDTSKGEQHTPAFRAINPNGKVPAIVDTGRAGWQGSAGVRFRRYPALSWREDGTSDRFTGRQAGIVVMAVFHPDRHWAILGTSRSFPACSSGKAWLCGEPLSP